MEVGAIALNGVVAALNPWWIAAAGFVLAAWGSLLALGSRRHSLALEDRLGRIEAAARTARERETQRPRLRAVLEQEVEVKWYLTIQNEGHGAASDFTVSIEGSSLEQCPLVDAGQLDPARLSLVDGHGTLRIPLKTVCRPERLQVELSWSDPSGELGLYEAELTGSAPAQDTIEPR